MKALTPMEDLIREFPLSSEAKARIQKNRQELKDILSGKDKRLLIILGPCSAWPYEAVLEYARKLLAVQDDYKESFKLILRVYTQKPRTRTGWIGPANQPNPFAPPDIEAGSRYVRKLMVELAEMGLPLADEAVLLDNKKGYQELLTWIAVGARSTENLAHRIFASSLNFPVGMKNPTSGSIEIGVNGVLAAQHSHSTARDGFQIETPGNPFAHLVLRGGTTGPNFRLNHLLEARQRLQDAKLTHPVFIVDASHDNSRTSVGKDPRLQGKVVEEVLRHLKRHPELKENVKGFMLESFLQTGCQNLDKISQDSVDLNGLSITDPCLGWDETLELIEKTATGLKKINA